MNKVKAEIKVINLVADVVTTSGDECPCYNPNIIGEQCGTDE